MANSNNQEPKLTVDTNSLFMKIVWGMIMLICGYASYQLRSLSSNVADLNIKMAVVVQSLNSTDKMLQDHEFRIRKIETKEKIQ